MIKNGDWHNKTNATGAWSSKLVNHGKNFSLKVAAYLVKEVNHTSDSNGSNYAGKEIILCGFSLNVNRLWEETQLLQHIQDLISKYHIYFYGQDPNIPLEVLEE